MFFNNREVKELRKENERLKEENSTLKWETKLYNGALQELGIKKVEWDKRYGYNLEFYSDTQGDILNQNRKLKIEIRRYRDKLNKIANQMLGGDNDVMVWIGN